METNTAIVLGVVAVLALLVVAMVFMRKRSADRLRLHFGPEYERTVEAAGGRHKAQAELQQRQKRVRSFAIKSVTSEEREHYLPLWAEVQTQFVDDPKTAVIGADQLLAEVMTHRGYPAGDFEQRSADLSVDHPVAVQNYRTAHDISLRDLNGEASTEDLRQAMLGYRALFRDLVGQPVVDEPIVEEPVEDGISSATGSTNVDPAAIETVPDAEVTIDEPAAVGQPVASEKTANVPEPVST
jgi:hypothetical protein